MILSASLRSPAPIRARPDFPTAQVPSLATGLEEVCVEGASGVAAGLGFVVSTAPKTWFRERGRPLLGGWIQLGLVGQTVLIAAPATETEALWALEEGLRSGAVGLAVGAVEGASLLATRRLDMAARAAGATVVLIKTRPARDLSAARRRWRVAPHPSGAHPFDPKASGSARWRVTLERSRDGASGTWILEHDLETHRLHLVEKLADHSLELGERDACALRRSG
jgi:protein ImuA